MLKEQSVDNLQQLSDRHKVLASIASMSGGDKVAYIDLSEENPEVADRIGLNTDKKTEIPEDLLKNIQSTSQHKTKDGQVLLIPVFESDSQYAENDYTKDHIKGEPGKVKAVIAVEKTLETGDENKGNQMEFSEQHIKMAEITKTRFVPFLTGDNPEAAEKVRKDMQENNGEKDKFLRAIGEQMHDYFGRGTQFSRHVSLVSQVASMAVDELNKDQSKAFKDIKIDEKHHDVLKTSVGLHDIGKVQSPRVEFADNVYGDRSLWTEEHSERNRDHPLQSFIALNLPGNEEMALVVSDHHKDGRRPFADNKNQQVISDLIAISDQFEAMTEKRTDKIPYSIEEAVAELGRRAVEEPERVNPQMYRMFVDNQVDEQFAEKHQAGTRRTKNIEDINSGDKVLPSLKEKMGINGMDELNEIRDKITSNISDQEYDFQGKSAAYITNKVKDTAQQRKM